MCGADARVGAGTSACIYTTSTCTSTYIYTTSARIGPGPGPGAGISGISNHYHTTFLPEGTTSLFHDNLSTSDLSMSTYAQFQFQFQCHVWHGWRCSAFLFFRALGCFSTGTGSNSNSNPGSNPDTGPDPDLPKYFRK
jgi:hypothetical protein